MVLRYCEMSFDARTRVRGGRVRGGLDTPGYSAAARVNRVLSYLRSPIVVLSQQARLMLNDHHDRRYPCPSLHVCISLKPDQPCHNPETHLVRLIILSLTGRWPVTARWKWINQRLSTYAGRLSAVTKGLYVAVQDRSSDFTPMEVLRDYRNADFAALTKHRLLLWALEGLLKCYSWCWAIIDTVRNVHFKAVIIPAG